MQTFSIPAVRTLLDTAPPFCPLPDDLSQAVGGMACRLCANVFCVSVPNMSGPHDTPLHTSVCTAQCPRAPPGSAKAIACLCAAQSSRFLCPPCTLSSTPCRPPRHCQMHKLHPNPPSPLLARLAHPRRAGARAVRARRRCALRARRSGDRQRSSPPSRCLCLAARHNAHAAISPQRHSSSLSSSLGSGGRQWIASGRWDSSASTTPLATFGTGSGAAGVPGM